MAVIWPKSLKSDGSTEMPTMVQGSHWPLALGWGMGSGRGCLGLESSEEFYTNATALEINFLLKLKPLSLINKLHICCGFCI